MSGFPLGKVTSASVILFTLVTVVRPAVAYQIYNADYQSVCNKTLWLDQGPNSAAILRLTPNAFYDDTPRLCTVTFKAPMHTWSGLLGVLEEVDLRRYEDVQHHLAQSVCIDYITITSPSKGTDHSDNPYRQEQCGSWVVHPGKSLPTFGYNRALMGPCAYDPMQCEPVRELEVRVVIGRHHERQFLWSNMRNTIHKGFTFVVTAYSFSYGVNECAPELQSCGSSTSLSGATEPRSYCIHDSLFCDGHINCGQSHGQSLTKDERKCRDTDVWSDLLTVVAGPWVGAGLLLLLALGALLYRNRVKARRLAAPHPQQHAPAQEFNSYAESYEVSSNLSSAHHMAIQVRVVCNPSGQTWPEGARSSNAPWKPDMPPSYETLFPHGPPEEVSNVPPQTHSPQFAHTVTGPLQLELSSRLVCNSVNSSNLNNDSSTSRQTAGMAGPSVQNVRSNCVSQQQTLATEQSNAPFNSNHSLDRRVPIKRECSRTSLLNNGVRINAAIIDASRLTSASDINSSPPSYDSDNYINDSVRYMPNACDDRHAISFSTNLMSSTDGDTSSQIGGTCSSNLSDNQNISNEATCNAIEESLSFGDDLTSSGFSETTHNQSCSEQESQDDNLKYIMFNVE